MKQPKVSIIIIIYQVEPFLEQCLQSVTEQTYQNIEIILVLGLGKDRCEEICDNYAAKDARIKLIKDTPKGGAVARNQGLAAATGDYIGFVDGDDWIEKDMFEVLVQAALKHDADISIVGKYMAYQNVSEGCEENKEYILNREQAFTMILYQEGFFLHLWDKLYKKEMFNGLQFPEDVRVEDRKIGCKLLNAAEKIVYQTASKYYFRVSEDSGSQTADNLELSLEEDKEIAEILQAQYPSLHEAIQYFMVYENISVVQSNMLYGIYSKQRSKPFLDYVRKHGMHVMKNKRVSRSIKVKILMCMFTPSLLKQITIKRRKKFLAEYKPFSTGIKWYANEAD